MGHWRSSGLVLRGIPADEALLTGTWVATRANAAGEPAYFHISNHGANIWALVGWHRVEKPAESTDFTP